MALQWLYVHRENKRKNEFDKLERALSYFERSPESRAIGISLVRTDLLKQKKYIPLIIPVLVSQTTFILNDSTRHASEIRNLFRLLTLLEDNLESLQSNTFEFGELLMALVDAAKGDTRKLPHKTLRHWFLKFGGSAKEFDENAPLRPTQLLNEQVASFATRM